MDNDYHALDGLENYQPPADWQNTPSGRNVLAKAFARKLLSLAVDFESNSLQGLEIVKRRDQAGRIIIEAHKHGFLAAIPALDRFVEWHTASGKNDRDPGHALTRVRCPSNLFLDVVGGHSLTVVVKENMTPGQPAKVSDCEVVDENPVDGVLPAIDSVAFPPGDASGACRFLADIIMESPIEQKNEPDGPFGQNQWRHSGEVVDGTMQVGAWKMVKHLWRQIDRVASFDDLIMPVYGDAEHIADEVAYGAMRREANKYFDANGIPWKVSISKGTVCLNSAR